MSRDESQILDDTRLKAPDDCLQTLTCASWNLAGAKSTRTMVDLLTRTDVEVLAAQELTQQGFDHLTAIGHFSESAFSLEIRPPAANEGMVRRLGCGIFVRPPWRIVGRFLLETAPLPERTMVARVRHSVTGSEFLASSFHAPPGVTHGENKPLTFVRIAEWLQRRDLPVILGMDCNTPRWDHPSLDQSSWHWKDEPVLLGHEATHGLRDALRVYLDEHPAVMEALRALRPDGPLEVSFIRGHGRAKYLCRYDHILISPQFRPISVRYLYNEAVQAGSDHALVVARLEGSLPITETSEEPYSRFVTRPEDVTVTYSLGKDGMRAQYALDTDHAPA